MRQLPEKLKVLDVDYRILYFESSIDVDKTAKEELTYQWDKESDLIRVHQGERSWKSICQSLWAVALKIIREKMAIKSIEVTDTTISLLATGLNTVMFYIGDPEGLPDEEEGKGMKLVDETVNVPNKEPIKTKDGLIKMADELAKKGV